MAEVRRRKGDGDTNDLGGDTPEVGSGLTGATSSIAEKQVLLEPLQLSDSATADSSDHVSKPMFSKYFIYKILLIFPTYIYCVIVFTL